MMWVFAIVIVLAMGGIALVAAGRGAPMSRAYDDSPDTLVPSARPLTGTDLRRVRFPLAVRGYRMAEVDALLSRLAEELDGPPAAREGGRGGEEED
ncbi:DivIVA domain-containing protein [Nocardioides insulae]|uniref:DivIVA domain-containing protein n=1 Tax=Nocardioides insulae TaxID=394734 RepID=UPI000422A4CB|nr:DivIVA domain-containing protein [Nocardioides insulae]